MMVVRWGILGTAKINHKIIPAFQASTMADVLAIASRSVEKATQAAEQYAIPRNYASYEDLLDDADVDAVYIPLPNHLHLPWSLRALQAGKHVLCEKPLGMNADEARQLLKASQGYPAQKVMEAFMYRFHPQWLQARAWVQEGAIGELRSVHTFLSYFKDDADNIRNVAEYGGGGLMDIGCYGVSIARFLFNGEPKRVFGALEFDPQFGVDRLGIGILEFDRGLASFTIGTQLVRYQRVQILGTRGRIELVIPINPPPGEPSRLVLQQGLAVTEHAIAVSDQYTAQCDAFCQAIIDDTAVPTPLEDSVCNMHILDRIKHSAAAGNWR